MENGSKSLNRDSGKSPSLQDIWQDILEKEALARSEKQREKYPYRDILDKEASAIMEKWREEHLHFVEVESQKANLVRSIVTPNNRGLALLDRKKALLNRDPDFIKLMNTFISLIDPETLTFRKDQMEDIKRMWGEVIRKWHVKFRIRIDPFFYGKEPFILDPDWTSFPGETPLVILDTEDTDSHFWQVPFYMHPRDKKSRRAAHRYLDKVFEYVRKTGKDSEEIQELLPIFRLSEKTFQEYLLWYDLHFNDSVKLSYRWIAEIDRLRRIDPQKAKEVLGKLKLGSVKAKPIPFKEDRVEKGLKIIYEAIHRKKYFRSANRKEVAENFDEVFDCPEHGGRCIPGCSYFKKWSDKFNQTNPMSRGGLAVVFEEERVDSKGRIITRRKIGPSQESQKAHRQK